MTRQAVGVVDVDGVGEDVRHALREDDAVGRSNRVARRTLTQPLHGVPTVRW
jgi:Mrp family chromosome partitioning ATPase